MINIAKIRISLTHSLLIGNKAMYTNIIRSLPFVCAYVSHALRINYACFVALQLYNSVVGKYKVGCITNYVPVLIFATK
jgi:hypothetical protein